MFRSSALPLHTCSSRTRRVEEPSYSLEMFLLPTMLAVLGRGFLQRDRGPGRLEAFSDGVFGIAMTLLVLDLRVPAADIASSPGLVQQLITLWPSFVAYLTSFMTILIMWINHHNMFSLIKRVDRGFMFYNGLLLLLVTFIPFPTSLVAEHLLGPDAGPAAGIYSGTLFLIAIAFNLLWREGSGGHGLLDERVTEDEVRSITRQYYVGPSLYGTALALSFLSAVASVGLCTAVWAYYALTATLANR